MQRSVSCCPTRGTLVDGTYSKAVQVVHALAVAVAFAVVTTVSWESSTCQWCTPFCTTVARREALHDVRVPRAFAVALENEAALGIAGQVALVAYIYAGGFGLGRVDAAALAVRMAEAINYAVAGRRALLCGHPLGLRSARE
jgi:hypothetical protein